MKRAAQPVKITLPGIFVSLLNREAGHLTKLGTGGTSGTGSGFFSLVGLKELDQGYFESC